MLDHRQMFCVCWDVQSLKSKSEFQSPNSKITTKKHNFNQSVIIQNNPTKLLNIQIAWSTKFKMAARTCHTAMTVYDRTQTRLNMFSLDDRFRLEENRGSGSGYTAPIA